jgi:ribonucrease Y
MNYTEWTKMYTLEILISIFLLIWSFFLTFKTLKINRKLLEVKKHKENNSKLETKMIEDYSNLEKKRNELESQTRIFSQQIQANLKKEELIERKLLEINKKIFQISNMTEKEIRQHLFDKAKENIKDELNSLASKQINLFKQNIHSKTTKMICSSLERYSSEIVISRSVDYLTVKDKKTVSRIIGKEGRNITFFRKLSGTDITIDKEKNNKKKEASETTIEISSFDSLRREIALQTLNKLIENEQKITPIYIERVFDETSLEIKDIIMKTGESVLEELQITDVDPDLTRYLGRLKYRTSYGQNVLEHSIEVAKLSGTIAAEIGLNPTIAKRAGLFHDIGKATEDLIGSSHVTSGIMLAEKYNESEIVKNAIASHHDKILANTPYSMIVAAADTLSAARPGSRSNQLETYLLRMKGLEIIGKDIEGIKKVYSFQAGREIWVFVDPDKVNDFQSLEIAREIKKRIKEKIIIPGDTTVSVIREKKFIEKIVNSGKRSQNIKH